MYVFFDEIQKFFNQFGMFLEKLGDYVYDASFNHLEMCVRYVVNMRYGFRSRCKDKNQYADNKKKES